MKNINLVVFLMLSINSFSQFFDNELDYLVYDKQDSLIKENKVQSLKINGFKFDYKDEKKEIKAIQEFNSKGLILKANKTTYAYDELDRLISIDYNSDIKGRKKRSIKQFYKKFKSGTGSKTIGIADDKFFYKYDSLNRIKEVTSMSITGDDNSYVELDPVDEVYSYSNDTIIIFSSGCKKNAKSFKKQIIENAYSKKVLTNQCINPYNEKVLNKNKFTFSEKVFDKNSLILTEKYWDEGEMKHTGSYFLSSDYKILKKIVMVSKPKPVNKALKNYNKRDFYAYSYNDEGNLIERKEIKGGKNKYIYATIIKFDYYKNGLLKREATIVKKNKVEEGKETALKEYEYIFWTE